MIKRVAKKKKFKDTVLTHSRWYSHGTPSKKLERPYKRNLMCKSGRIAQKFFNKKFGKYKFPDTLYKMGLKKITDLKWTMGTILKCQNCGLYNRVPHCISEFRKPTFEYKKWLENNFDYFLYIVFHNNGTYWWEASDPPENKHLSVCVARQLKGAEAGTTWYIHRTVMSNLLRILKRKYKVFGFLNGNCKMCGKCPLKDKYKECQKGMPSPESVGIACYKTLENWDINFERVPINKAIMFNGFALRKK